mgnify:CR=1 FL=1
MQHWSVTVTKDAEQIVCIESNCLSGKGELSDDDEALIRRAAEHLLSFIGVTYQIYDRIPADADYPF